METVSAIKMRKSQEAALKARPFAHNVIALLDRLSKAAGSDIEQFLRAPNTEAPTGVLLVASDRGLCGSYNSNVFKKFSRFYKDLSKKEIDSQKIYVVGKVGVSYLTFRKIPIVASFERKADVISLEETEDIFHHIYGDYSQGKISSLMVFSTEFISTLKQQPTLRKILPFNEIDIREIINLDKDKVVGSREAKQKALYIFEPDAKAVLEELLPYLFKVALMHVILEANASEHSARMVAMRNARDNATHLLDELQLSYNKARQELITRQISEIVGGKEALTAT